LDEKRERYSLLALLPIVIDVLCVGNKCGILDLFSCVFYAVNMLI
jgi:hypothetical protein